MKLLRLLAMATCLFALLCASQQPVHVHAGACEDACNYNLNACTEDGNQAYDWCYSDAENEYSYCEGDAWTSYNTCLNGAGGFPLWSICAIWRITMPRIGAGRVLSARRITASPNNLPRKRSVKRLTPIA
jgi:hypothetical protein